MFNHFKCQKYFRIFKNHNPKKPLDSFWLHLIMLQLVGLWAPENKFWTRFYWMYSYFCTAFWVMFFLLTQVLFFITVTSVAVRQNFVHN